ncbi:PREDICTED: diphthine methyltransferase homolog [Tarenaya hassleriana]|uniref:diphthine methyltransferase homolog n=1 Tax=Tarenaya hassleriana TaxID=28532 RepID=UPI00053C5CFC|nr:PREDICTED: diphthine methyltransferase homolog [Tarenaya hassleriana]
MVKESPKRAVDKEHKNPDKIVNENKEDGGIYEKSPDEDVNMNKEDGGKSEKSPDGTTNMNKEDDGICQKSRNETANMNKEDGERSEYTNLLAASTYTLQEGDRPSRSGSISLFDVDGGGEDVRLNLIQHVETAGVFDIRWSRGGAGSFGSGVALAQADADGCLRVYGIEQAEERGPHLREISGEKISSSMCLCLDWDSSSTSIAIGLSDGSVSVVSFTDSKLETLQEWKAHDFELWATSFDLHNAHLVYTGSDDCKFSCWDIRESPQNHVFKNSKSHSMGVCCIAPNPNNPYSVFTGSYDENLRVWDMRSVSRPVNDVSVGLGGGVWRIKHHPLVDGIVLVACMHNGFAVVNVGNGKAEVMETYNKHGSLAYGADWQRGKDRKLGVVATCSFYDRLLRLWKPETDICG